VQVTANPIDQSLYIPDVWFKKEVGLNDSTKVLLFVGRFIVEKGILDLIEACRLLKEVSVDFHLFCLGDGPLFREINDLIHLYGLGNQITVVGHVPEKETRRYYSNCDVLILPTYHQEGFPMAVFQAIGAGKPVITTRIRAAADHLLERENCLWVEKKNPIQICGQVVALLNDKCLYQNIQRNNLLLSQKFTSEQIIDKLINSLEELLKDSDRG
jgi:glycosyltransferase involved in cell wall biosynthesis